MKHNAKPIEIKFAEPEAFALVVERAAEGERIAKETTHQLRDRQAAEKQQIKLIP
jgi:hypothetical protein